VLKRAFFLILAAAIVMSCSGCYLFTPLSNIPRPADFRCVGLRKGDGRLLPLELDPKRIYGIGLSYADHLKETGSDFDPEAHPPVFKKALSSLNISAEPVRIPARKSIVEAAEGVEPGLGKRIDREFEDLPPLLDYEGELAFMLLEDVEWERIEDPGYAPKLGYFLANDISARTIAVLGEGRPNRYEYWGVSKSFPGFLPVGDKMWVPYEDEPDSILCTYITTTVNGLVRQRQTTRNMMYTPREMLFFISKAYPDELPSRGDVVLTGTSSGVALQVPAWKAGLANILRLDRFVKLFFSILSGEGNRKYLRAGDVVRVSGGMLGVVETRIIE
jgi:2-keto-4-pentenoate hydratase/2-oxohepta-3-ene-1,7-dioic acid hydratase in catechol pathway